MPESDGHELHQSQRCISSTLMGGQTTAFHSDAALCRSRIKAEIYLLQVARTWKKFAWKLWLPSVSEIVPVKGPFIPCTPAHCMRYLSRVTEGQCLLCWTCRAEQRDGCQGRPWCLFRPTYYNQEVHQLGRDRARRHALPSLAMLTPSMYSDEPSSLEMPNLYVTVPGPGTVMMPARRDSSVSCMVNTSMMMHMSSLIGWLHALTRYYTATGWKRWWHSSTCIAI